MAASRELTLTEELFRATQLNKYRETINPIRPGSGLPEKMFEGSQHAANYVLDTRLTFKVNKWKKGKTTKTKKVINPNIMFTMFGVFCNKSAGAVRKDLCEWISLIWSRLRDNVSWGWLAKTWILMIGSPN